MGKVRELASAYLEHVERRLRTGEGAYAALTASVIVFAMYRVTTDAFLAAARTAADAVTHTWKVADAEERSPAVSPDDFPAPEEGFVITHFLVVSDQDRSRDFYARLFDGRVLLERDPVIMKVANTWLILNEGGGPTEDKPTVALTTPQDPNTVSAFLNVRVADIQRAYEEWSAKGAEFLTPPQDRGAEIRAYIRDPDGHLIEVGQATGILES